eukprot:gnl/TRDRNA2_/TRDRNA2_137818_c0_seq1.p1 gnl/TRDRNA2_/TRDRNA2_137818_c0~~gnl/TRDRNA2_/TRDRNA2_137818_c0_seq1.p1  ORF type:complete len:775 (-),score=114.73 gnl/TRDRNA2_/TRDRNA2_137818_c0_seq1:219-2543(-)
MEIVSVNCCSTARPNTAIDGREAEYIFSARDNWSLDPSLDSRSPQLPRGLPPLPSFEDEPVIEVIPPPPERHDAKTAVSGSAPSLPDANAEASWEIGPEPSDAEASVTKSHEHALEQQEAPPLPPKQRRQRQRIEPTSVLLDSPETCLMGDKCPVESLLSTPTSVAASDGHLDAPVWAHGCNASLGDDNPSLYSARMHTENGPHSSSVLKEKELMAFGPWPQDVEALRPLLPDPRESPRRWCGDLAVAEMRPLPENSPIVFAIGEEDLHRSGPDQQPLESIGSADRSGHGGGQSADEPRSPARQGCSIYYIGSPLSPPNPGSSGAVTAADADHSEAELGSQDANPGTEGNLWDVELRPAQPREGGDGQASQDVKLRPAELCEGCDGQDAAVGAAQGHAWAGMLRPSPREEQQEAGSTLVRPSPRGAQQDADAELSREGHMWVANLRKVQPSTASSPGELGNTGAGVLRPSPRQEWQDAVKKEPGQLRPTPRSAREEANASPAMHLRPSPRQLEQEAGSRAVASSPRKAQHDAAAEKEKGTHKWPVNLRHVQLDAVANPVGTEQSPGRAAMHRPEQQQQDAVSGPSIPGLGQVRPSPRPSPRQAQQDGTSSPAMGTPRKVQQGPAKCLSNAELSSRWAHMLRPLPPKEEEVPDAPEEGQAWAGMLRPTLKRQVSISQGDEEPADASFVSPAVRSTVADADTPLKHSPWKCLEGQANPGRLNKQLREKLELRLQCVEPAARTPRTPDTRTPRTPAETPRTPAAGTPRAPDSRPPRH